MTVYLLIGSVAAFAAAVLWGFFQGKKDAQLTVAQAITKQQTKTLDDVRKSNSFDARMRLDPAFAERMRQLVNAQK